MNSPLTLGGLLTLKNWGHDDGLRAVSGADLPSASATNRPPGSSKTRTLPWRSNVLPAPLRGSPGRMTSTRRQAVRDHRMQVDVRIVQVPERTAAWRELWRRLLSPPPCQSNDLPLDCGQDDAREGLADLTSG